MILTSPSKICRGCEQEKDLEGGFYDHPQMADGHLNFCKECVGIRISRYSKTPNGRATDHKRQQTPRRRKWQVRYTRKRRQENPEKYKANMAVGNAVRDGRLYRCPCEICGNEKVEAHHDDYSKPLRVKWLCFKHHRELHEMGAGCLRSLALVGKGEDDGNEER